MQQALGSFLIRRAIVKPEHDQRHLVEPQQVGKTGFQVGWDFGVAAFESDAQVLDGTVTDQARLFAEWRERVGAVRRVTKKRRAELAVRLQQLQTLIEHDPDPLLQFFPPRESR